MNHYFKHICLLAIILMLHYFSVYGQNMQQGFDQLNTGKYAMAQSFFKDILLEHPENKTARICYARAIGLYNNPTRALSLFAELLQQYPGDKEIELNLAESYLWNSNPTKAIDAYLALNSLYPKDEIILRSLANAYAADKNYQTAYPTINKSLQLNPDDQNSLQVYKSISLAYAHQLKVEKNYDESLATLKVLEKKFTDDPQLVLSKAYLYLAQKEFNLSKQEFLRLQDLDSNSSKPSLGLATIALQQGKYGKSIAYLKNMPTIRSIQDSIERSDLLFGNYLNTNPNMASQQLDLLKPHLTDSQFAEKKIYLLFAQEKYDEIPSLLDKVTHETNRNNIYLRYVLDTKQVADNDSFKTAIPSHAYDEYTHQLISKMNQQDDYLVQAGYQFAEDNGMNKSKELTVNVMSPIKKKIRPFLQLRSRWLSNNFDVSSNHSLLRLGTDLRASQKSTFSVALAVETRNIMSEDNSARPIYYAAFTHQMNQRHHIKLSSYATIMDYNADLLEANIWKTNFIVEHHIVSRRGIGSYSQFFFSKFNDDNTSYEAFNSLYINAHNNPIIQTGINSTALLFNNSTTTYFSPESVFSISPFLKVTNEYSEDSKFKYSFLGSVGKQFGLSNSTSDLIYNIQTKIGYPLTNQLYSELFYHYTNNSSSVNNGFSTYITGLNIRYKL